MFNLIQTNLENKPNYGKAKYYMVGCFSHLTGPTDDWRVKHGSFIAAFRVQTVRLKTETLPQSCRRST